MVSMQRVPLLKVLRRAFWSHAGRILRTFSNPGLARFAIGNRAARNLRPKPCKLALHALLR
jgi:hypothetical protein